MNRPPIIAVADKGKDPEGRGIMTLPTGRGEGGEWTGSLDRLTAVLYIPRPLGIGCQIVESC